MLAACLGREPMTMLAWPLRSHLELGAFPTAVPCARLHARLVALEWGLPALAETTELLVSELATNAVRASAGLVSPVVRLCLASDRRRIVIRVWDGGDQMPVRKNAEPDSECGRGLLLVESLSTEWGSYRKAAGKVVWAMISAERSSDNS
jgi:anti-sigma regulatory factor (Ser/Thr protein kinase)